MKKICFVTTIPLTFEAFILKTAEYLHDNHDWDISVICNKDQVFAEKLPPFIHYYPVVMERGISIGGVSAMIQMAKIFHKEHFDIIQYSTPNASLYASLAGFITRIPVRLYCQWGIAYVGFSGLKRKIFKAIETTVCALSTRIEPDSHSNLVFSHEERLYKESKGSVIWNGSACGVNLQKFDIGNKSLYREEIRFKYDIPAKAFVFGFVGRITRDKGVNELLCAFKKLSQNNPNMYLLMVGPSEVDETIDTNLYDWANQNDHIIFAGYTNCVEKYLAAMDVYILPSYREGFGMGVVEAEAMGVPVIVTNIPGPIDAMLPGETGEIVKKKSTKELYWAMKKMLSSDDLTRYGVCGHSFAIENFEQAQLFAKIAEDREALINKLML